MKIFKRGGIMKKTGVFISILSLAFTGAVLSANAQIGIFEGSMDIDNGRLGAAGSASYDAATDTYTVNGSGDDVWNEADAFHFVYKQWNGDFVLEATVGVSGGLATQDWIKAMLMARQDLTPGAVNTCTRVRRDGQYSMQWRTVANDTNSKGSTASDKRPVGLNGARHRFERVGNTFNCLYLDANGNWVLVDSHDVPMTDPIYVGLGVTAHDTGQIATGTFTNVVLKGAQSAASDWQLYK